MKMIERVRDAIEVAIHQNGGFDWMSVDGGNAVARAAIEAMREPTDEMFDAVLDDAPRYVVAIQWQKMIDAALQSASSQSP